MAFYAVEVFLEDIICRDAESIHSSDKFALSGAILTDTGEPAGFTFPTIRINTGETRSVGRLLFKGAAKAPKVGLVFQAWDIDSNEAWIENRADIDMTVRQIAQGIKFIPKYGLIAGTVLDGAREIVINVVDQFVEWDKNDSLINYRVWHDLPPSAPHVRAEKTIQIDGKKSDPVGYSSFDYSLRVTIRSTPIPPLWPPQPPPSEADDAARTFRHRADAAEKIEGFVGAFPTFFYAERGQGGGRSLYGGAVLLNAQSSEWRDVPAAALGNPNKQDFGHRMRVTQKYATREGFIGGFPNFHEGGGGAVFGTVLVKHSHATWRDVPIGELGNPPLDKIAERFKATQEYAKANGFIGGFPNFFHADYGGGDLRCGTILIPPEAGEWRDIFVKEIID